MILLLALALLAPQDKKKEEVARWMSTDLGPVFSTTMNVKGPVPKAVALRVGEAAVAYDEDLGRVAGGWTGGFVKINPDRDALLGNDSIQGTLRFSSPERPGWDFPDTREAAKRKGGPLPRGTVRYRGLHLHGPRVVLSWDVGSGRVLEHPWAVSVDGATVFTRTFRVRGLDAPRKVLLASAEKGLAARVSGADPLVPDAEGLLWASVPAGDSLFTVLVGPAEAVAAARVDAPDPDTLVKGGPRTWTETLVTKGVRGAAAGAFAVDTIAPPFDNPWKSILHFGGHDFYADGSAAICTMEGDVWKVTGIDEGLERVSWQRIATGLYHPLGLRIVKDAVYVACRDQIARLHDLNGDGQIDHYEVFNNDVHVGTNSHEFMTCLETDAEGNFYTIKGTNEGQTIHDSSVLRISADGKTLERWATGFRWPNGLGLGPGGVVTAADQQGTWMPSSRLDRIEKGGFYGYMNSHHREKPPETYDGPLCWIPHGVDNSSAAQVWVESRAWGPLQGRMLHLSYGKCQIFLVLEEQVGGRWQGGVVQIPLPPFQSGAMRGRFRPQDGQLYVSGLRGWQTSGVKDGCFQRVRYVGGRLGFPLGLQVRKSGIRLEFPEPLAEAAGQAEHWTASRWNYRWTSGYGSPHFSVANPAKQGEDALEVKAAKLSADRRSVVLEVDDLKPVMQMKIGWRVPGEDGVELKGAVYHTIHALGD
jgi:sugar lactone lactonase YvrE